jgi:hypothetical protein
VSNFVLIKQASEHSKYTPDHIRYLIRHHLVSGQKVGAIWLVDLDGLKEYEARMDSAGTSKFRPKSLDEDTN